MTLLFPPSDPPSRPPPRPLRSPAGPGRPYPPAIVAAARALVVDAGLSYREAAARAGLREDTVGHWARRFGWRRAGRGGAVIAAGEPRRKPPEDDRSASLPHAEVSAAGGPRSTQNRRASFEARLRRAPQDEERGSVGPAHRDGARERLGPGADGSERPRAGRPYRYGAAVWEAARVRVEGSRDGLERIANELGISRGTLHGWCKRFRWRRPPPPERGGPPGTVGVGFYRSRRFGRPYGGDAVGTVRDLFTGSTLPISRIAARAGVTRVTVYRWAKRHGWARPRAAVRRRYSVPYGPEIVAAARELYEMTGLSTRMVAARAKAPLRRVQHWARTYGWTRPRALPDPYHLPDAHGHYPLRRTRTRRRTRSSAWLELGPSRDQA